MKKITQFLIIAILTILSSCTNSVEKCVKEAQSYCPLDDGAGVKIVKVEYNGDKVAINYLNDWENTMMASGISSDWGENAVKQIYHGYYSFVVEGKQRHWFCAELDAYKVLFPLLESIIASDTDLELVFVSSNGVKIPNNSIVFGSQKVRKLFDEAEREREEDAKRNNR